MTDPPPARRPLRRMLVTAGVLVAVTSMVVLGAFNISQASLLLDRAVEAQLAAQGEARAQAIRTGLQGIRNTVSALAVSSAVGDALTDFTAAFEDLDDEAFTLDDEQRAALDVVYQDEIVGPLQEAGLEVPPTAELRPATTSGEWLQYHYLATNPEPEDRSAVEVVESDTSPYAEAHARWHAPLRDIARVNGFTDLLLLDRQGNVVYSTAKNVDLGVRVEVAEGASGPLAGAANRLATAPSGQTVFLDGQLYAPQGGEPVVFAAARSRLESTEAGSVVATISLQRLTELTSADGQWEDIGLGETGQAYIVGVDRTLRTDTRDYLEGPEQVLEELREAELDGDVISLVELLDTTVLLQPVDSEAVETAFDGEVFTGTTRDFFGRSALTFADTVADSDLDWVVVAQISTREAGGPLWVFLRRLLIALAVLLPLVVAFSVLVARALTRPVQPVLEGARAVAEGELDHRIGDVGRNEFGDVAARINTFAERLQEREAELEAEELQTTRMLLAALPPRLVEEVRQGRRHLGELADNATVVAFQVGGVLDQQGVDTESAVELSVQLSAELEALAEHRGIERVRSSSVEHLFAAGLGRDDLAADAAVAFAREVQEMVTTFGERHGATVALRGGVGAGSVIASVVSGENLTYGVFGEPVEQALRLSAVAEAGEVLVHADVVAHLADTHVVSKPSAHHDLKGDPIPAGVLGVGVRSD